MNRVHPIEDPTLGNTSYLLRIGDGLAAAVDPPRDTDELMAAAERAGVRIVASLETHLHADFVSGSRELAERTGADVYASKDADLRFGHTGLGHGDGVWLGGVEVGVLHTPGHTPEHVCYLADGADLFTGGSLILGGAARTDLVDPGLTVTLARSQFHSMRRLAALPDEVAVHPTHGAGSFCSAGPARSGETTIGGQRRGNPLLRIDDADAFVAALTSGFGSFPPYFLELRTINRDPVLLADLAPSVPITPEAAAAAMQDGAWLIDARPAAQWAVEHPDGAVSNALRSAFASWLGWIVPFGEAVVLLVSEGDVGEVLRQSRRIGYDRVVGWIEGGLEAWKGAGLPTGTTEQIDAREAARRQGEGAVIVDVRQASELIRRIPRSVHVELGDVIAGRLGALGDGDALVVHCAHGERSATAVSLLQRRGIDAVHLDGGIDAWLDAGLDLVS